jgi:hypothetical protein
LSNDWANASCTSDTPPEQGNAADGRNDRFDSEKVADLVNWEPDEGQGSQPEDDESDEIVHRCAERDGVIESWSVMERWPNRGNHEIDTLTTNPGLDSVPNTSHYRSVEDGPEGSKDTKGGSVDHGKADVVFGADTTCEYNEEAGDGVADPDAQPCWKRHQFCSKDGPCLRLTLPP